MSLIEVMVVAGIMGILMISMLTLFSQQAKSNNYLEFQNKREQLRLVILGQFLNNSDNCQCLFSGATEFPIAGITALTGYSPVTSIGKFNFVTAGICATATIPDPFVNSTGVDGVQLLSADLKNISFIGGTYGGDLVMTIKSLKEVVGPGTLSLKIPVAVVTAPGTPGNVVFQNCSINGATPSVPPVTVISAGITCGSGANLGTGIATCPVGTTAVSCGTYKDETSSEDVLMCKINPATNSCEGFRDLNSGCDTGALVQCYCL